MKNNPFLAQPCTTAHRFEEWGLPRSAVRAVRIGLSRLFFSIETTTANKNQQLTAGDFGRDNKDQQKSTQFNGVSKSQQKSAKSVPVHERSHQKSSEIITGLDHNHQKSSIIITNHQKSALVGLVCKPLTVLLRPKQRYWNIKECVTGRPGTSYKFLLQTDL